MKKILFKVKIRAFVVELIAYEIDK